MTCLPLLNVLSAFCQLLTDRHTLSIVFIMYLRPISPSMEFACGTQPKLTCSTVQYVLAPLIISVQYYYYSFTVAYILMSDDINECILLSYEPMEINCVDTNTYTSFVH